MKYPNSIIQYALHLLIIALCLLLAFPLAAETKSACYIVYDAGSSGTRLYIYEKQPNSQWVEHEGPKVDALADPVREIRGKTLTDMDKTTTAVVDALEAIKQDGPLDDKGKPKWQAFDWSQQCQVHSAQVLATAGMRIAEQENRQASATLWQQLRDKLSAKVGAGVSVSARTLTGFEEGLFAWLTVKSIKQQDQFGIVEMGGASSQVTFPCPNCDTSNDAVKTIQLEGQPLTMYSYSFLGLGQDEAPKTLGFSRFCQYGIGTLQSNWQTDSCANSIALVDDAGIFDPYNYQENQQGIHNRLPSSQSNIPTWYLTGAFNYAEEGEVEACCQNKNNCYKAETACFRAVYLDKYLRVLNVPIQSEKVDASWTKGAVVCEVNQCMQQSQQPVCRWADKGCL